MDDSELIKEELRFIDSECNYIEEKCPYCGHASERIEDEFEEWVL